MGVAGGMLMANAIGGIFAGIVQASEVPEEEPGLGEIGVANDSEYQIRDHMKPQRERPEVRLQRPAVRPACAGAVVPHAGLVPGEGQVLTSSQRNGLKQLGLPPPPFVPQFPQGAHASGCRRG